MMSVKKSSFPDVELALQSLSADKLRRARTELEQCGKTTEPSVNKLLRNLSLYGFRQPMSRELRLSMRRKIRSLIVRHGIPAIWFTLNPNDITNPVKLKLAAYRARDPEEAEAFLTSLDVAYKRVRLAISDPPSSALFFHREISMFFRYYVKVGEDSIFGRINQYFGAVETNERGALHLHGLLWLHGNMELSSVLSDVAGEGQGSYKAKVTQYVDSVFTEVCRAEGPQCVKCDAEEAHWMDRISTRRRSAQFRRRDLCQQTCQRCYRIKCNSPHRSRKRQTSVQAPPRSTRTARRV